MTYKKPQMVVKSVAKKTYVAGCPEKTWGVAGCCPLTYSSCEITRPK